MLRNLNIREGLQQKISLLPSSGVDNPSFCHRMVLGGLKMESCFLGNEYHTEEADFLRQLKKGEQGLLPEAGWGTSQGDGALFGADIYWVINYCAQLA